MIISGFPNGRPHLKVKILRNPFDRRNPLIIQPGQSHWYGLIEERCWRGFREDLRKEFNLPYLFVDENLIQKHHLQLASTAVHFLFFMK